MARIKSKRSALQTLSCKFGGMAQHTPLSPMGAEDVCNFRILPDGSLRVRSGYTLKKQFSSGKKVRGFWEGTVGRTSLCFAVVGDKVYRLSGDEMDETAVGTVYDGDNNVHFFVYKDVLYLLDGQNIRMHILQTCLPSGISLPHITQNSLIVFFLISHSSPADTQSSAFGTFQNLNLAIRYSFDFNELVVTHRMHPIGAEFVPSIPVAIWMFFHIPFLTTYSP